MGLDIFSIDREIEFHIGYFGFTHLRGLFAAHYDKSFYQEYVRMQIPPREKVRDLYILLEHSDSDGELTSEECQKLLPCLHIDEELINSLTENKRMVELMCEFKEVIRYCAENPDVKLIFW